MKFLRFIKSIFTPTAFKIGVVLTLTFASVSVIYYKIHPDEIEYDLFFGTLDLIHKKTVDLKMRSRGPRPISPEVVLVVVDDESLEKIGRWVWPRSIFANLITKLGEDDVNTIALDVIFSEPETLAGSDILKEVQSQTKDHHLKNFVTNKIKFLDNDAHLKEAIEKYKDKVILGSYFTDEAFRAYAHKDLCYNLLYERTSDYAVMSQYEYPIGILDATITEQNTLFTELPEAIKSFLNKVFDKIGEDYEKQASHLTPREQRKEILAQQSDYCSTFLITDQSRNLIEKNWPLFQKREESLASLSAPEWIQGVIQYNLKNPIHGASQYQSNIPTLSQAANSTAYFRAFLDQDGVIRTSKLVSRYGNKVIPSLALAAFLQAKQYNIMIEIQENPESITSSYASRNKIITNFSFFSNDTGEVVQKFPIDQYSKIQINYAGKQNTFPYISASEILGNSSKIKVYQTLQTQNGFESKVTEQDRKDYLKNKIVLVGATAVGIYDLRVSPLDSDFPGLEIHANTLDNLLQNNMYRPISIQQYPESYYMPFLIILLGFIFSYWISHVGALWGFLTSLTIATSLILADYHLLFLNNYVTTIIFPVFTILFIYVFLTFYKYLTEERKKQELKGTFQKYVSPSIVNEILSHPEKVELGGRKENMTVLFSDVRGFTTFAEKLEPTVLGDFLTKYLTPMTRLVFKNNGTLDKYMGDAIMAFFGAPIHFPDHAKKCCITALEMIDKLKDLNQEFEKQKLPSLDIGIGINTGDMSVGNMGSDIVRSYTVMGDSVNLASRLEGINKNYGTRIIISEFTYEKVKDDFICRGLDLVRVKGKVLPVKIYELMGHKKIKPELQQCTELFHTAYELYLNKNFEEALRKFNEALNIVPNDGPAQLYVDRCQEYLQNPPTENWDGVYEFKTK